jgi:hypothetical protein
MGDRFLKRFVGSIFHRRAEEKRSGRVLTSDSPPVLKNDAEPVEKPGQSPSEGKPLQPTDQIEEIHSSRTIR